MRTLYNLTVNLIEKHFKVDAQYFLSGGFWLIIGQFASITFGLTTTVLFAYFLSESDYGIYRYLIGIAVILSSFSLTGLGQSIFQTAAKKYYGFYHNTLGTNFIYSLPIVATAIIGSIYYWTNENIILSVGCLLIAIFQPIINTFQFIPSFLQGSRRFKESTLLHTVRMLVISTISIVALLITDDVLILFAAYLASYFITNLASHVFFHPKTTSTPKEIISRYLNYAKHTSIRNIIGNVAYRLDAIIIFTQLGGAELAIYTIANIIPEQIKASFKNLTTLILPKYAQQEDDSLIKKNIPKRSFQLFILFSIITFLYIILSPFLYTLLFPKYETAIFFSQLIALSFPAAISVLPISLLLSQKNDKKLHLLNIQSSTILILFTLTLIPVYGLLGAIIAKILFRYCNAMLTFYHLYKKNENSAGN